VSDTTQRGRSFSTSFRLMSNGGRALLLVIGLVLILASVLGGFVLGRQFTYEDVLAGRQLVQQLQAENQTLNHQIVDQSAHIAGLQANLTNVQSALNAIMPTKNTYTVNPNQSMIVADGHLTIGLVGSPSNQGVNLNINGKQQSASAGDVIQIALDPSTTCQVEIQSFDMFRAVLTASCVPAKPH
jgi:FlaG/FlaF family flagellin (archaellin)